MKILGIIPSRYGSSRFPGKPLVNIEGKPMIQRVYEQAKKCTALTDVIVATDDQRIADAVTGFGGKVVMTNDQHQNGTERCAEAIQQNETADAVINIQGDEPFIHPEQIDAVAQLLTDGADIATLVKRLDKFKDYLSPNIVKVAISTQSKALYFSRSPLPFIRDEFTHDYFAEHTFYKHIGIYGYKTEVLKQLVQLPYSMLEDAEKLEQLRWLDNGYTITVAETTHESIAIDVPSDLLRVVK
jgi:3-deoxy-manno-octulosonate cytidylyltransferase (CMP-KDO synthetase)